MRLLSPLSSRASRASYRASRFNRLARLTSQTIRHSASISKRLKSLLTTLFCTALVVLCTEQAHALTYYYKAGSPDPNLPSSWNTLVGGGGTNATNFTTNTDVFIIPNGRMATLTANLVLGTGANGVDLTIQNGGTLNTATFYVELAGNTGSFNLQAGGTWRIGFGEGFNGSDNLTGSLRITAATPGTITYSPTANYVLDDISTSQSIGNQAAGVKPAITQANNVTVLSVTPPGQWYFNGVLTLSGALTVQNGGEMTVFNTLTLNGAGSQVQTGSRLNFNGTGVLANNAGLTMQANSTLLVFGVTTAPFVTGMAVNYMANSTLWYQSGTLTTTGLELPATMNGNILFYQPPANALTLGGPTTVNGSITLLNRLNTSAANMLTIGNTAAGAIAQSGAGEIRGPMRRVLPAGASAGTWLFPVSKGASYLPFAIVNPSTTGGATIEVEAFNAASGGTTDGATISGALGAYYWQAQEVAGNFNSGFVQVGRAGLTAANSIGSSTTLAGTYSSNSVNTYTAGAVDLLTRTITDNLAAPTFFAVGTAVPITTFYYQSGNPNTPGNWNSLLAGGGTPAVAADFTTAGNTFIVPNGRTVTLTANLTFGAGANNVTLTVQSGGVLDIPDPRQVILAGDNSVFNLQAGATLRTSKADGINGSAEINGAIAETATGPVTLNYDVGAKYIFNGAGGFCNFGAGGTKPDITQAAGMTIAGTSGSWSLYHPITITGGLFDHQNTGSSFFLNDILTLNGTGHIINGFCALNSPGQVVINAAGGCTVQSNGIFRLNAIVMPVVSGNAMNYAAGGQLVYATSPALTAGLEWPPTMNGNVSSQGAAGDITLGAARTLGATGTLFLASLLNTSAANMLTVNNTTAGAVGYAGTGRVLGPMRRLLPNGGGAGTWQFPVGVGANQLPFSIVNPAAGSASPLIEIEAFAGPFGGTADGTTINTGTLSTTEYWRVRLISGTFSTGLMQAAKTGVAAPTVLGSSTILAGPYSSSGTNTYPGGTPPAARRSVAETVTGAGAYFALGTGPATYYYESGNASLPGNWGTTSGAGLGTAATNFTNAGDHFIVEAFAPTATAMAAFTLGAGVSMSVQANTRLVMQTGVTMTNNGTLNIAGAGTLELQGSGAIAAGSTNAVNYQALTSVLQFSGAASKTANNREWLPTMAASVLLNNTFVVTLPYSSTVTGTFTANQRLSLSGAGTVLSLNADIVFGASGEINSASAAQSVVVAGTGTVTGDFDVGGGAVYPGNLTLNRAGMILQMRGNRTMSGVLDMTAGILKIQPGANWFAMYNTTPGGIINASATSYIDVSGSAGLYWMLPASMTSGPTYTAPIGTATQYLPVSLLTPTTGAAVYRAIFYASNTGQVGGIPDCSTITSLHSTESWSVGNSAGGTLTAGISLTAPSVIASTLIGFRKTAAAGTYPSIGSVSVLGNTVTYATPFSFDATSTNNFFNLASNTAPTVYTFAPASGDANTLANWSPLPPSFAVACAQYVIPNGRTANLSANLDIGGGAKLIVQSGGTVNTGASSVRITGNSGGFDLQNGSTFITQNTNGVNGAANNSGAVQITAAIPASVSISYGTGVNFSFGTVGAAGVCYFGVAGNKPAITQAATITSNTPVGTLWSLNSAMTLSGALTVVSGDFYFQNSLVLNGTGSTVQNNSRILQQLATSVLTIANPNGLTIQNGGQFTILSATPANCVLGNPVTYQTGSRLDYWNIGGARTTGLELPSTMDGELRLIGTSGPISLSAATVINGTLALSGAGNLVTSPNMLTIANTAAVAVTRSGTGFVDGFLRRALPAGGPTAGTWLFPVGKGGTYLPFAVTSPTTAGGATIEAEAFTVSSGGATDGTTITGTLGAEYWQASVSSGSFTSGFVQVGKTGLTASNAIGSSTTLAGTYASNSTNTFMAGTPPTLTRTATDNLAAPTYFAVGTAPPPTFYYQSLSPNTPGNWNTLLGGGGTAAVVADFTTAGRTFIIPNGRTAALTANLAFGAVANSVTLTVQSGGGLNTDIFAVQFTGTGTTFNLQDGSTFSTQNIGGVNGTSLLSGAVRIGGGTPIINYGTAVNFNLGVPSMLGTLRTNFGAVAPKPAITQVANLTVNIDLTADWTLDSPLTVDGTFTLGNGVLFVGDMALAGSLTLSNTSTGIVSPGGRLKLRTTLNNNSSLTVQNTGQFWLVGVTAPVLTGMPIAYNTGGILKYLTTTPITAGLEFPSPMLGNVDVDITGGTPTLTMTAPRTLGVNSTLALNDSRIVNTLANRLTTLNGTPIPNITRITGYIDGYLERTIGTAGAGYLFPMGEGTDYLQLNFTDVGGAGTVIVGVPALTGGSAGVGMTALNATGRWEISTFGGSRSGTVAVRPNAVLAMGSAIGLAPSLGGSYDNIGPASFVGGAAIAQTIPQSYTPTPQFLATGAAVVTPTYYYRAGNADLPGSWFDTSNLVGGTAASNFTTSGTRFIVMGGGATTTATITAPVTLAAGVSMSVNSPSVLRVNTAQTFTNNGTLNIAGAGTLELQGTGAIAGNTVTYQATSSVLRYSGTAAKTVTSSEIPFSPAAMTGTVIVANTMDVTLPAATSISMASGTQLNVAGGVLAFGNATTLSLLSGSSYFGGGGGFRGNPTATFTTAGTGFGGCLNIYPPQQMGSVIVSGGGGFSMGGTLTVVNALSIAGAGSNLNVGNCGGTTRLTLQGSNTVGAGATLNVNASGTGILEIDGNANITGAGSVTYASPTATRLEYTGAVAVPSTGIEFPGPMPGGVTVNNTGGVTLSANRQINGIFTMQTGTLDISGRTLQPNAAIAFSGGTINGNATSALAITGAGAITGSALFSGVLGGLTMNRAAATLALGSPLALMNTLTLTQGYVQTTPANILTVPSAATITGGSTASHVAGPMRRDLPAGGGTYAYPVGGGTAGTYLPVTLNYASTAVGTSLDLEAVAAGSGGTAGALMSVGSLSATEYWRVNPTAAVNNATLTFQRTVPALVAGAGGSILGSSTTIGGTYNGFLSTVTPPTISNSAVANLTAGNMYYAIGSSVGPPVVTALAPTRNNPAATPLTSPINITFSQALTAFSARTFGSMTGRNLTATSFAGGVGTQGGNNFRAGEKVNVSVLTPGTSSAAGSLALPHVYQFRTGATGGTGNFVDARRYTTPTATGALNVVMGEFDGSLGLDMAVSAGNTVRIYRNDGTGKFSSPGFLPVDVTVGAAAFGMGTGDFDGDGDVDIMVNCQGAGQVWMVRNDGGGVFTPQIKTASTGYLRLVVADFDGDGDLDFANCLNGFGDIYLYSNDGFANFSPAGSLPTNDIVGLDAADIDNDGDVDLIMGDDVTGQIRYALNNGNGTFAAPVLIGGAGNVYNLQTGDVNGDGFTDIIHCNTVGSDIFVRLRTAPLTYTLTTITLPGVGRFITRLDDIDGDGDLDIIAINTGQTSLLYANMYVLKNDGSGNFTPFSANKLVGSTSTEIGVFAAGDLDGDGDMDIAIPKTFDNQLAVIFNHTPELKVTSTIPAMNAAAATEPISITPTFNQTASTATFSLNGPIAVFGNMSAARNRTGGGSWAGSTFTPNNLPPPRTTKFFPGEKVEFSITTQATTAPNGIIPVTTGTVRQFRARANMGPANFSTPVTGSPFFVGTNPYSVALGDVDGDGDLDMATANQGSSNVSVLLNNGSGAFTAPAPGSPFAVGGAARFLTFGDVDGDGDLDLAVARIGASSVVVLLNNGAGTYTPAIGSPFAVGTGPWSVDFGDADGDGDLDLAVANFSSNNVTVLLNNSVGTFTPAAGSPFAVGTGPSTAAFSDVDGDGDLDLATANSGTNDVTVLLNNGTSSFAPAVGSPFAVGMNPRSVAFGDIDGDGDVDMAVPNQFGNNVTVLVNNGSALFTPAVGSPFAVGTQPISATFGDVDGDGSLDLATSNQGSGNITVLLNNGGGVFTPVAGSPFTAGTQPNSVAFGDIDGDGDLDLAAANNGSNNVSVLLNALPLNATATAPARNGNSTTNSGVSAHNALGTVAAQTTFSAGPLTVATGRVFGTQSWQNPLPAPTIAGAVATLTPPNAWKAGERVMTTMMTANTASAGLAAPFVWDYRVRTAATSPGTLYQMQNTVTGYGTVISGSVLADFDGDGNLDVASIGSGANNVYAARGLGNGNFAALQTFPLGAGTPFRLTAGDFNNDGRPDIAVIMQPASAVRVILNTSPGAGTVNFGGGLAVATGLGGGAQGSFITTGDMDGDGNLDLIATEHIGAGRVSVMLGNGAGGFAATLVPSGAANTFGCGVADFDGDGDMDIAAANWGGAPSLSVFLNSGNGTTYTRTDYGGGQGTNVGLGDFDLDGDVDIALTILAGSVQIFTNNGTGTFTAGASYATGATPRSCVVQDANGDGDLDLFIGADSGPITFLTGAVGATFTTPVTYTPALAPLYFAMGDLDNDGDVDMVTRHTGGNQMAAFMNAPSTYYYVSGDASNPANWNSVLGGGGSPAPSFLTPVFTPAATTLTFIVPSGLTAAAATNFALGASVAMDVQNNGTLVIGNGVTMTNNSALMTVQGGAVGGRLQLVGNGAVTTTPVSYLGLTSTLEYAGAAAKTSTNIELPGPMPASVVINNTGGVMLHASRQIDGTFTAQSGWLNLNASALTLNGTMDLTGTGALQGGTGSGLAVTGAGAITGGLKFVTAQSVDDFTINRTGAVLPLGTSLSVANTLSLTQGNIVTSPANLLSVANASTMAIAGGSANSFVVGPLARSLSAGLGGTGGPYTFPVGKSTVYYPTTLENLTTGGTPPQVTAEAFIGNAGGTAGGGLTAPSTTEYWNITATGAYTSGAVTLVRPAPIVTALNTIGAATTQTGSYTGQGGMLSGGGVKSNVITGLPGYFLIGGAAGQQFYYQSGDPSLTTNWNSAVNGSGAPPLDFATLGNVFIVPGPATTMAAGRTAALVNSITFAPGVQLWIESGAAMVVNAGRTLSQSGTQVAGTLRVVDNGVVSGPSVSYTAGSTLEYAGNTARTTTAIELPTNLLAQVVVNNPAGVWLEAGKVLSGGLALRSGAFDFASKNVFVGGPLEFSGGTVRTDSVSTLEVNGTGAVMGAMSTALPAPSTLRLNTLTMNRAGRTLALGSPVEVGSVLSLNDGVVRSSAAAPLTVQNGAVAAVMNVAGYVEGPLVRTLPASNAGMNMFAFPIGKRGFYLPMALDAPFTSPATQLLEIEAYADSAGTVGTGLVSISKSEYIRAVRRTAGGVSGVVQFTRPSITVLSRVGSTVASITNGTIGAWNAIVSTVATLTLSGGPIAIDTVSRYFIIGSLGNPPYITTLGPPSGSTTTTITLTGDNFTGVDRITIGGVPVTNFTVISPTEIQLTAPPGVTTGTITVFSPSGAGTSLGTYQLIPPPVIRSFGPLVGPPGTIITVTGANFSFVTGATIGGIPVLNFSAPNDSTMYVVLGEQSGPISFFTEGGKSTSTESFINASPPVISEVTPTMAGIGEMIRVFGRNLISTDRVTFGSLPAMYSVISDNEISVTIPAGTPLGSPLTVRTAIGSTTASRSIFQVGTGNNGGMNGMPIINTFQVSTTTSVVRTTDESGRMVDVTMATVTLEGLNLYDVESVTIDGRPIPLFVSMDGGRKLVLQVPITYTGIFTVVTRYGTARAPRRFEFEEFVPRPVILRFTPTSGGTGQRVVITGQNFIGVSRVTIGGERVLSFMHTSNTEVICFVGLGSTGRIEITCSNGTALSNRNFVFTKDGSILKKPVITDFAPVVGSTGTTVTIVGEYFENIKDVRFGGVPVQSFVINSSTEITAIVGAGATGLVSASDASDTAFSAERFTFVDRLEETDIMNDSIALVRFYTIVDGRGWRKSGGWKTLRRLDDWDGVTVGIAGGVRRVLKLELPNNNIVGYLHRALAQLTAMRVLNLSGNALTTPPSELGQSLTASSLPLWVGRLRSLEEMRLANAQLRGRFPDSVLRLSRLRVIDLSDNQHTGGIPEELAALTTLREIVLAGNRFTGRLPERIAELANLEVLDVSRNQLVGYLQPALAQLLTLKTFRVAQNQFTGTLPPFGITALAGARSSKNAATGQTTAVSQSQLVTLDVGSNFLDGTIPPTLGNLQTLATLALNNNLFAGDIPPELWSAPALATVMLQANRLTGGLSDALRNARFLRVLMLDSNRLSGSVTDSVSRLGLLRVLTLSSNRLTSAPDLSRLGRLDTLRLDDNSFTFESLEPNKDIPYFLYQRQSEIFRYDSLVGVLGKRFVLDPNIGGRDNVYRWYKREWKREGNGWRAETKLLPEQKGRELVIEEFEASDTTRLGYYCLVDNPNNPELTLVLKAVPVVARLPEKPVAAPVLVHPVRNARNVAPFTAFEWEPLDDENVYEIQVSRNQAFTASLTDTLTNTVLSQTVRATTATFTVPRTLELGTRYWWRVRVVNRAGAGPWSETTTTASLHRSFETVLPGVPLAFATIDFGRVARGERGAAKARIANMNTFPVRLLNTVPQNDGENSFVQGARIAQVQAVTIPPRTELVTLSDSVFAFAPKTIGTKVGNATLTYSVNTIQQPEQPVSQAFIGRGGALYLEPAAFDTVLSGRTAITTVRVINRDSRAVTLHRARVKPPRGTPVPLYGSVFEVEQIERGGVPLGAGDTTALVVKCRPKTIGRFFDLLEVEADSDTAQSFANAVSRAQRPTDVVITVGIRPDTNSANAAPGAPVMLELYLATNNRQALFNAAQPSFLATVRYGRQILSFDERNLNTRATRVRNLAPANRTERVFVPEFWDNRDVVLARVPCRAVQGDTDQTRLQIENLVWGQQSGAAVAGLSGSNGSAGAASVPSKVVFVDSLIDGSFTSLLCKAGGKRLVRQTGSASLTALRPNPANNQTTLAYTLRESGRSTLQLFDAAGVLVTTLIDRVHEAGTFELTVNLSKIPSGSYMVVLETPSERLVERLNVVK